MTTLRTSRGKRVAWLLFPLLVLAAGGRSICWCADEESHCADGGSEATELASCHGHEQRGENHSHGTEHQPTEPCSPSHDCCCIDTGAPIAPAPEGPALDHHAGLAFVVAPAVYALPLPREVRTIAVRLRPPKGNSPPLFVVHCSFLC